MLSKADANRKHTLTLSILKLVSLLISKKTILTYTGSELGNKRINCEKGGFRAIHTENDADMFISWRRMINGATEYSRGPISEIFLASTALSYRVFSRSKQFLDSADLSISILLENRFLQVVSFSMKKRRQKV